VTVDPKQYWPLNQTDFRRYQWQVCCKMASAQCRQYRQWWAL